MQRAGLHLLSRSASVLATPGRPAWSLAQSSHPRHAHNSSADDGDADIAAKAKQQDAAVEDAIKDSLRQLYKQVHPDLFGDRPAIKAENERSFKLLQEYLQQARAGDNRAPAARLPYNFTFYIRQQQQQQGQQGQQQQHGQQGQRQGQGQQVKQDNAGGGSDSSSEQASKGQPAADESEPGFSRIKVTLPPPQSDSGRTKTLPRAARRGLAKLLDACGVELSLPADAGGYGLGLDGFGAASDAGLSLAEFLPEATEALRQHQAGNADPAVRLANLRGAFRLGRQLLVSFPSDSTLRVEQRVRLLERLAAVLDAHPAVDVRGCRVLLGAAPTGIDRLGHLCLHQDEDDRDWAAMLTQVDVPFALQQVRYVQAVRTLEASVARTAGLLMVYTTPVHLPQPSYRALLERLASHAATAGAVAGGKLRAGVAVCVLPPHVRHTPQGCPLGRPLEDDCVVDEGTGVVYLVDDLAAPAAYAALERLGDKALLCGRVHSQRQVQVEALSARVRQALKLRRLMKDPVLSQGNFESACKRLLNQAEALSHVLDGSLVRIGFANRLAPDGSCIELAWDFVD